MFQTIGKLLLRKNNILFIPSKGIAQALPKRPRELNNVQLMGTIEHQVKRLNNGSIKLYLKTFNEDTSYCIHRVAIANKSLLDMVQNRLAVNQRIYIGGKLKTETKFIENKLHQDVEILANEMYFLDSNPIVPENDSENTVPPIHTIDDNSLEMLAYIGTEVQNEPRFSAFSLVTHFTKNKDSPNESEGKEFHRVMIYDNRELAQIARHLRKHDQVYVTGFINYLTKQFPDGNEYTDGFIQPTNLVKLKRFGKE